MYHIEVSTVNLRFLELQVEPETPIFSVLKLKQVVVLYKSQL